MNGPSIAESLADEYYKNTSLKSNTTFDKFSVETTKSSASERLNNNQTDGNDLSTNQDSNLSDTKNNQKINSEIMNVDDQNRNENDLETNKNDASMDIESNINNENNNNEKNIASISGSSDDKISELQNEISSLKEMVSSLVSNKSKKSNASLSKKRNRYDAYSDNDDNDDDDNNDDYDEDDGENNDNENNKKHEHKIREDIPNKLESLDKKESRNNKNKVDPRNGKSSDIIEKEYQQKQRSYNNRNEIKDLGLQLKQVTKAVRILENKTSKKTSADYTPGSNTGKLSQISGTKSTVNSNASKSNDKFFGRFPSSIPGIDSIDKYNNFGKTAFLSFLNHDKNRGITRPLRAYAALADVWHQTFKGWISYVPSPEEKISDNHYLMDIRKLLSEQN